MSRQIRAARRTDTEVAVIVSDRGRYQPQPRPAGPTDETGRGLSLLEMLAARAGVIALVSGRLSLATSGLGCSRPVPGFPARIHAVPLPVSPPTESPAADSPGGLT